MNFTTVLKNSVVASTKCGVMTTNQFKNISVEKILDRLKTVEVGEKDGSHFIRTALMQQNGLCSSRADNNTESTASLLIIDCDKHIDSHGNERDGAPNSHAVSDSLKAAEIGHILFGSYSYYCGTMRYRIILVTTTPYSKEQLGATAESIVALINTNLTGNLLAYASENTMWSQPWYYPRKPENSIVEPLYIEYLEGNVIEPIDSLPIADITHVPQRDESIINDEGCRASITFADRRQLSLPVKIFYMPFTL